MLDKFFVSRNGEVGQLVNFQGFVSVSMICDRYELVRHIEAMGHPRVRSDKFLEDG